VFAGVVIVGVAVPATLPRIACLVLLGVVDSEVVGLEPSDLKRGACDSAGEVSKIVVSNDSVWCVRRLCMDTCESGALAEVSSNPVEDCSIDGASAWRIVRPLRHRCDWGGCR